MLIIKLKKETNNDSGLDEEKKIEIRLKPLTRFKLNFKITKRKKKKNQI